MGCDLMGRTLTPDGKRVSIGLKVSEAKAAAINAARGATPRALWLEAAIDACLALPVTVDPPAPPPPDVVEEAIVPLERGPERRRKAPAKRAAAPESTAEAESEGERITAEIESDPDEVARLRLSRQQARQGQAVHWDPEPLAEDWDPAPVPKKDCKHPNMRVKKGFCPDCQTWVSGGR